MSTFEVILHFFLKFKPFDEIFPFQNVIANLSVCVASVYVYYPPLVVCGYRFPNRLYGDHLKSVRY